MAAASWFGPVAGGAAAGAADGRANSTTPDKGLAPGPGARVSFRPVYIRRAGRRAKRRGPVEDMPVAISTGLRNWAKGDTKRLLTVGAVLNCGRTGEVHVCPAGDSSFSPVRCSETSLCPGCARKATDLAASLAAADLEAAVRGVRDLRQADQSARDRLTHRLALIGVVGTVPEWLEKFIRPGDRDAERRLWEAFDRFIKKMLPGTGVFAGVDWFGDQDSRVRPHVDARLLNVRRGPNRTAKCMADPEKMKPCVPGKCEVHRPKDSWSTFATRRKGCIKHARRRWWEKPKPLNARTCGSESPCEVHGLHQAWTDALQATFERHLPPADLNEVRDWNAVINWHFDALEGEGKRHAPKLAKDWDGVIAARCSYSAKPPVEVVTKWSVQDREEGGDGVPPASTFDALWAIRGDEKTCRCGHPEPSHPGGERCGGCDCKKFGREKGIRRIRRFGWLAPSVRRARLLELRQVVEPLGKKEKVVPICGREGCWGKSKKIGERIGIAEARAAKMPLLRWLRPDELPPVVREPAKYEPRDRRKTKKEYVKIGGRLFSQRVRVERMEPDEGAEPWVCVRCDARLKVKTRPRYCWKDLGGCGRHESYTSFRREEKGIGIELPYEWWIEEFRAVLDAMTARELDECEQVHKVRGLADGCGLCAVNRVKPPGGLGSDGMVL